MQDALETSLRGLEHQPQLEGQAGVSIAMPNGIPIYLAALFIVIA